MSNSNIILIIEDETAISTWLEKYFNQAGFKVLTSADGQQGLQIAQKLKPDLIILDLNLPNLDGLEICQQLRQHTNPQIASVAIIMLTARVEEIDRLQGLEIGADDYVIKPFSPKELVARAKALLRRINGHLGTHQKLWDGELCLDLAAHKAFLGERTLALTPHEFNLLKVLLERRNQALSREQLITLCFGYDYEGLDRTVDVHIRNLRQKIETDNAPKRIETVFGVGYRLNSQH